MFAGRTVVLSVAPSVRPISLLGGAGVAEAHILNNLVRDDGIVVGDPQFFDQSGRITAVHRWPKTLTTTRNVSLLGGLVCYTRLTRQTETRLSPRVKRVHTKGDRSV